MKKQDKDLLKPSASTNATTAGKPCGSPIRILELPGFREIEDKLLLYSSPRGILSPELEDELNELSEKTFGILQVETLFELPDRYRDLPDPSEERFRIEVACYEFENQFETSDATDDEAVTALLTLGFDFRDDRGLPLRCTKQFMRQAEAAAKGIMGQMPDLGAAEAETWGSALEQDARLHRQKKKAGS